MAKSSRRPRRSPRPTKRPTNLSLDLEAIARGERFSERHGTSLSRLVSTFLYSLPADEIEETIDLSPAVRRLYGVAAGRKTDRESYRKHLTGKYASR